MTKNLVLYKSLVFVVIVLFLVMSITPSVAIDNPIKPISSGNTLYVGGSGPGNYTKIQDAVANCKLQSKNNINDDIKIYNYHQTQAFEGYMLYSPEFSFKTKLKNNDGEVLYNWVSDYFPGLSVYLLENGNILRTGLLSIQTRFLAPGLGGCVQEIDLNNNVVWMFNYSGSNFVSHHDIEPLPNDNILMIAWEYKTKKEATDSGRNPNYVNNLGLWPVHIIEVEPTDQDSGDIVWEWHVWDHLIQDYDPSKDNYGVMDDHPELVDINYNIKNQPDIMHTNSIDYNEDFDQIMISVPYYNEIWVIDHSTTTEEAAGHTGGNSGKGGDLLYRWGNPRTYDAGTESDQKLFFQHDASWIKPGYLGEGNILVFNNGVNRPNGSYSSVDEIIPPVNESGYYTYVSDNPYEPEEPIWSYSTNPPGNFYSSVMGGAQRLQNGNTRICSSTQDLFFEVTQDKETVWQYNVESTVFKINTYPIDYPGLQLILPAPYPPSTPSGPTYGIIEVLYTYTTNTTDPNGDQIYYLIDWGDGTDTGWIGPYDSGDTVNSTHKWISPGNYEILVKAKDIYDHESAWSDPLIVNIQLPNDYPYVPKNPSPYNGETNVNINANLFWIGGDPDPDDNVTYDVYFEPDDSTPDVLVSDDQLETTYDPGSMNFSTNYFWQIVATDKYGFSTIGPIWNFVTEETPQNLPPIISLENPENKADDLPINLSELSVFISDPEEDLFSWTIETSPDIGSSSGIYEQNGTKVCSISKILDFSKTYTWLVNATDTESGYVTERIFIFTTIVNQIPEIPSIVGPSSGKPGKSLTFIFNALDPDGDNVRFHINWGDSTSDNTTYVPSGTEKTEQHTWDEAGIYFITANAEDTFGNIGPSATFLVIIPRNKAIFNPFLNFLQNHPNLFPLLQKLLQNFRL